MGRPRFPRGTAPLGLLCLVVSLLAGCASSGTPTARVEGDTERAWTAAEATSRLRAAADRWDGAPHQLGGSSTQGVDCSGLVQSVYANEFGLQVPRTTEEQVRVGRSVSRSQLQPGDLVFFRPEWKDRHVGIYLSDGRFLHASASEGVTVSDLRRSYWTDSWWQARRVLPLSADSRETPTSPQEATSSSVGW